MRLYYDKQGKPQLMRTPKRKPTPSAFNQWTGRKPYEGKTRAWALNDAQVFLQGKWVDCSSEYDCFWTAKQRCNNPNDKAYKYYGGRGICFRFVSFPQFINHLGLKPSPEFSIDRINNDGHYTIGNVRWATPKEQSANRRRSKK